MGGSIRREARMRTKVMAVALATSVALGGAFVASAHGGKPEAKAVLLDATGANRGTVWLQEEDGMVNVRAVVSGLTPGFHGFHIHAVGTCDPSIPAGQTSPFTSAGGHFNPSGATHASHAGDQPVLLVNADGTASSRFASDRYEVGDLFDADGSALIVHAFADNYANISTRYSAAGVPGPDAATLATGDAGGRVLCGVIEG